MKRSGGAKQGRKSIARTPYKTGAKRSEVAFDYQSALGTGYSHSSSTLAIAQLVEAEEAPLDLLERFVPALPLKKAEYYPTRPSAGSGSP